MAIEIRCDGWVAQVEVDESGGFHGRVLGRESLFSKALQLLPIRDVITFESSTWDGLRQALADSVADYEEFCQESENE